MDDPERRYPRLVKRELQKRPPWSPWSWVAFAGLIAAALAARWCFGG